MGRRASPTHEGLVSGPLPFGSDQEAFDYRFRIRLEQVSRTTPAPSLEKFKIMFCDDIPYHLHDKLFNDVAPNLRRLTLCNCYVSPNSTFLRGITQLKLRHCFQGIFFSDIIPVLSRISQLESLFIDMDEVKFKSEHLNLHLADQSRVRFPRLRALELWGPVTFMVTLLEHLSIPPTASIITRNTVDPIEDDTTSLVRLVESGPIKTHSPPRALLIFSNDTNNTSAD